MMHKLISTILGAAIALVYQPATLADSSAVSPIVNDCDGTIACSPMSSSTGPLLVIFTSGTGHRNGICGCIDDDTSEPPSKTCQEELRCFANFNVTVRVGIGKMLGWGATGCTAANGSGDATIPVGCSDPAVGGCGCTGGAALESCDAGPNGTCINCTQTSSAAVGCSDSQCASRSCN